MTYSTLLKGLALSALTASFALCFLQPAEARDRSERRSPRRERHSDDRSDRHRDRDRENRNDDWGYRAFIPDGGGGQIFYGDPDGYYPNGNLYGGWYDNDHRRHDRPYRIYRHRDDYGYGDGLSVNLSGDNFSLSYNKRGRRIYSAPDCPEYGYYGNGYYDSATYVYGDGPIVIDGSPRNYDYTGVYDNRRRSAGDDDVDIYNDNRSYDDNDTVNYYYEDSPIQPAPERSRYIETPREQGPVNPHRDSALSGQRTIGLRFFDETKLASSDGGWRLSIQGGKLYAGPGKAKGQLVDSKVDERFGAYALWNASHGLSLVYRSGGEVLAASRDSDGSWYSEPLPYNVDFSADNTLGLVSGELWFTFSASDGLRYVVALRDGVWSELGSASGVR